MNQKVFIFIGHSGAGKGTQVALLESKLTAFDPQTPIFHLETGKKFRELITGTNYTSVKTRELMEQGILPPPFIAAHIWTHNLIEGYDGVSHVFMDGTPRAAIEVPMLLSAADFYNWNIDVIHIDVGDVWAHDRLIGRHREDDLERGISQRIEWYHQSVVPAIEALKKSDRVTYHHINGEQSIEAVHEEIEKSLSL
jgi:adenylate kinase family enzyme